MDYQKEYNALKEERTYRKDEARALLRHMKDTIYALWQHKRILPKEREEFLHIEKESNAMELCAFKILRESEEMADQIFKTDLRKLKQKQEQESV